MKTIISLFFCLFFTFSSFGQIQFKTTDFIPKGKEVEINVVEQNVLQPQNFPWISWGNGEIVSGRQHTEKKIKILDLKGVPPKNIYYPDLNSDGYSDLVFELNQKIYVFENNAHYLELVFWVDLPLKSDKIKFLFGNLFGSSKYNEIVIYEKGAINSYIIYYNGVEYIHDLWTQEGSEGPIKKIDLVNFGNPLLGLLVERSEGTWILENKSTILFAEQKPSFNEGYVDLSGDLVIPSYIKGEVTYGVFIETPLGKEGFFELETEIKGIGNNPYNARASERFYPLEAGEYKYTFYLKKDGEVYLGKTNLFSVSEKWISESPLQKGGYILSLTGLLKNQFIEEVSANNDKYTLSKGILIGRNQFYFKGVEGGVTIYLSLSNSSLEYENLTYQIENLMKSGFQGEIVLKEEDGVYSLKEKKEISPKEKDQNLLLEKAKEKLGLEKGTSFYSGSRLLKIIL